MAKFSLPNSLWIFKRENSVSKLLEYPWLLSNALPRRPLPSFLDAIKHRHLLQVGIKRVKKHLHYPAYGFPDQFISDAQKITTEMFHGLNADNLPMMSNTLGTLFSNGYKSLQDQGKSISFVLRKEPRIRLNRIHLTYGAYPPKPGYIAQQWIEFQSHPHQEALLKKASDEGVYIHIDTIVDLDVELILKDIKSDIPLLRDRRRTMSIEFISPHFTPWDELFELNNDGTWSLKWKWRISDVDGLMAKGWNRSIGLK